VIDGRSVYTPLFSGVYWDVQDTMLEDIDRIEVIRVQVRPSGEQTLSMASSTSPPKAPKKLKADCSPALRHGRAGIGSARYGGKLGETAITESMGSISPDSSALPSGAQANDAWNMYRGGFRTDWNRRRKIYYSAGGCVCGEVHQTEILFVPTSPYTNTVPDKDRVAGANLIGRWTRTFSPIPT